MAISNFTRTLVRSVFPSSLLPSRLLPTYKKLSYIESPKKSVEVVLSADNLLALSMLLKTYSFKYRDIEYERLNRLGICTVVSVVVNGNGSPEIGLLSLGDEYRTYAYLSDLIIQYEIIRSV